MRLPRPSVVAVSAALAIMFAKPFASEPSALVKKVRYVVRSIDHARTREGGILETIRLGADFPVSRDRKLGDTPVKPGDFVEVTLELPKVDDPGGPLGTWNVIDLKVVQPAP